MKKNLLTTLALFVFTMSAGFAQLTATSVQDGNWLSISTWDCNCIPFPSYSVTINHDVILDTSYAHISGTFLISSGASLRSDATPRVFAQTGGTFTNNGTFEFDTLAITSGTFINNDSLLIDQFGTTGGTLTNNDYISCDSMANYGSYINHGLNETVAYTNAATLDNDGELVLMNFTNMGTYNHESGGSMEALNFWNTGTLNNHADITATNVTNSGNWYNSSQSSQLPMVQIDNFWNNSAFSNTDAEFSIVDFANSGSQMTNNWIMNISNNFYSEGTVLNNEYINVVGNFYNGDTTLQGSVTHFTNNGHFNIGNNFWNADTIDGTGQICVAMNSLNDGVVTGTLNFCDTTGTTFDLNNGTIGSGVTFCGTGAICFGPAPVAALEEYSVGIDQLIFPNPSMGLIHTNEPVSGNLSIYDSYGRVIRNIKAQEQYSFDLSDLPNGVYYLHLNNIDNGKVITQKVLIAK